ncbi:MAG: malic enzyme [Alphaproteobacteria bacterium]|nr:NADP-dependent malic enzyme [SAR116 cluster bacterium]GIS12327.1 MAG: malic enzyme [Alphaproteobacteria bacterium]|tara:strand:- start:1565 stop:3829 length:2265 start_codon:yes stop_codon:yes gene_type:complete
MSQKKSKLDQEALAFHANGRPGKLEITATKPLMSQHDLSLAYSPGVAAPCLAIEADPDTAYDYTAKGNVIAVISNGTAVLGLGDIGAAASKPVMEGKAVLFKKFADIDGLDLEVDTKDTEKFVEAVAMLAPSFGGINLEDIKSPECFIIEQQLRERLEIPVFHDDQHGTAIIAAAGLINALHLTGRDISDIRVVSNGAGAASIACVELFKSMGVPHENIILVDRSGVIYQGREASMNQWKSAHAVKTDARTLEDALVGADVFLGLSVAGAVTPKMVETMAERPIIFAMANPVPEIMPEDAKKVRPDAIIATGRSDYPNQVNNVLGFPYIFRGALDVRASKINEEMKIAAAEAIAMLAREDVPDAVAEAYGGQVLQYGEDYIIPAPFDPRLISAVSSAVAAAAMESGVARKPIEDLERYRRDLSARLDPTASTLQVIFDRISANRKRVVFAEGEEEKVIRAAMAFRNAGYGEPILVGREHRIRETIEKLGLEGAEDIPVTNAKVSDHNEQYIDFLYKKLQREGALRRDCQRMVNLDRNVFGACMVLKGHADAMVTGVTRSFQPSFDQVTRVISPRKGKDFLATSMIVSRGRTVFIGDVSVHERPNGEQIADIAEAIAGKARQMGHTPRVAILSFTNFGSPQSDITAEARRAIEILDKRKPDFEYDGEMSADVALDYELMKSRYPFCRLSGPANILVMPGLHSANIAFELIQNLTEGSVIGPIMLGAEKPFQVVQMGASVNDLVQAAALAAYEALR